LSYGVDSAELENPVVRNRLEFCLAKYRRAYCQDFILGLAFKLLLPFSIAMFHFIRNTPQALFIQIILIAHHFSIGEDT
jgi:hypothetical protein